MKFSPPPRDPLRPAPGPEPTGRPLLDVREVAALLTVSVSTVWRLRDQGVLPPSVRLGSCVRWRLRDIEDFLRRL